MLCAWQEACEAVRRYELNQDDVNRSKSTTLL
jgi:hypothetical protein